MRGMRRARLLRVAQQPWLWLAVLAVIFLIRFPVKFLLEPPYLMDLEVYRHVAQRVVRGQAHQLYEPTTSELMVFKYAPCWALIWLPLAWLSAHASAVVWAALTVLWLVLACRVSLRLCHRAGVRAPPWLTVIAVILLVRALTAEFLNGQVNVLWALLVMAWLAAETSSHPWRAAAWLGLAISLKLPAAIVLFYLAVTRHWQAVGRTVLLVCAMNLIASVVLLPHEPARLLQHWLSVLWSSGAARAFEIGNQSLLALVGRFFSADPYHLNVLSLQPGGIVGVTLAMAVGMFSLVVLSHRTLGQPARLIVDSALLMVLMALCSPTAWIATYGALLLPLLLVGAFALTPSPHPWRSGWVLTTLVSLGCLSLMTHSSFWRAVGVRHLHGETYVFLVLMIFPWLALALFASLWAHPTPSTWQSSPVDRSRRRRPRPSRASHPGSRL